ncbi:hypothetical protein [Streptomyces sp. 061-3]|uniref:hypothetical protein n=1 Tax=Streptomyces sp. 061-3 TaxID=2789268 RepID=UPI0039808BB9
MSSTTEPDRDGRGSPLSADPRPSHLSFMGLRTIGRLPGLTGVTKAFVHRRQVLRALVGGSPSAAALTAAPAPILAA